MQEAERESYFDEQETSWFLSLTIQGSLGFLYLKNNYKEQAWWSNGDKNCEFAGVFYVNYCFLATLNHNKIFK